MVKALLLDWRGISGFEVPEHKGSQEWIGELLVRWQGGYGAQPLTPEEEQGGRQVGRQTQSPEGGALAEHSPWTA